jgi:hypothetical protein
MSRTRAKLALAALLLLLAVAALLLAMHGLANLVAYFQRGADPAAALNIVPNQPPDLHVSLEWQPDAPNTGRTLEPETRAQIEAAYLRAWLQWNISYLRGEPYGLNTSFVGPARQAIRERLAASATQGMQVTQSNTAHRLRLNFYSADGSIVSLTDERALVAHISRDTSGAPVLVDESAARYDMVMTLEDGTWRIRHLVRTGDAAPPEPPAPAPSGFVARQDSRLLLDGQPYQIAGMNYYPQATPWDAFWRDYDPQIIERDFALLRSLELNTVRVFVPFEQFGGPDVDPQMLDRLADLLDRADAHDLKVIVTLFDFRTNYDPLLWPQSDRHLEALLTRFADNSTVLAWDIKNEPDRDYAAAGRATVDAWLAHTLRIARQSAPHHLLTIGWSEPQAAPTLAETVDIVSFHYYAPAADLPTHYAALRRAAPERPLLLGEFGLPTWNSPLFPHGHTEREQAAYYADTLAVLRMSDSAGFLAWTLYDFDAVPPQVAGRFPWQTGPQRYLGVLRADGTPKPAAALLAPAAALDVPRPAPLARFIKPFWLTLWASALVSAGAAVWWWRRQIIIHTPR